MWQFTLPLFLFDMYLGNCYAVVDNPGLVCFFFVLLFRLCGLFLFRCLMGMNLRNSQIFIGQIVILFLF